LNLSPGGLGNWNQVERIEVERSWNEVVPSGAQWCLIFVPFNLRSCCDSVTHGSHMQLSDREGRLHHDRQSSTGKRGHLSGLGTGSAPIRRRLRHFIPSDHRECSGFGAPETDLTEQCTCYTMLHHVTPHTCHHRFAQLVLISAEIRLTMPAFKTRQKSSQESARQ
jgi:hypothetical protein